MPPTPLESLLNQYQNRSTDNTTASSSSSISGSDKTRQTMLSTSSARLIELEARITRQQNDFDRKDKISSDRLSQIERQLHRFDEVDTKLDTMKTEIDKKLEGSQKAQTDELRTMSDQIITVMEKQVGVGASINILSDKISLLMGLISEKHQSKTQDDTIKLGRPSPNVSPTVKISNSMGKTETLTIENPQTANMPDTSLNPLTIREDKGSVLSMKSSASKSSSSTESGKFQSPEKKKQRPGTQKN